MPLEADADHQSFENRAASLEHAKTSSANRRTSSEHARPARHPHSEHGTKNPIIQEKIKQVRKQVELPRASTFDKIVVVPGVMQSQAHSIQTVQKPWQDNRMKDVLFDTQRQMPTMQKVQNTKVVNP